MTFNKGDVVTCVYPTLSTYHLKKQEYIIEKVDIKNGLVLVGVDGCWNPMRFRHTKNTIVNRILNDL